MILEVVGVVVRAQITALLSPALLSGVQGSYYFCSSGGVPVTPEAQLIHILSNFHYLLHEIYPTNRYSSQERAVYGTSCLLLTVLNPITCPLSNLRSINLIWSLSRLSLSLPSIGGVFYRPSWPFFSITH